MRSASAAPASARITIARGQPFAPGTYRVYRYGANRKAWQQVGRVGLALRTHSVMLTVMRVFGILVTMLGAWSLPLK